MRGKIDTQENLFVFVQLEEMIPKDHLLMNIKDQIDFSFIDKHTENLYSNKGRPSIDPQVLVRMMLIGYLYGITSERRLCQEVHLNIAYRWFCGLRLEDKVPNHSSFSKNRNGRFSETDLFRKLFQAIVKQAQEKGLIKGKYWSTDATLVAADAAMRSLEPIEVPFTVEEYLQTLDQTDKEGLQEKEEKNTSTSRLPINDTHRSSTDSEARVATRWGSKKCLAYSNNILVDSTHNIIIDVEVSTPSLTEEGLASVEMVRRSEFKLGIVPQSLGADSAYGRGEVVAELRATGVNVYIPRPVLPPSSGASIFSKEDFVYDAENDHLICPNGKTLKPSKDSSKPSLERYRSTKAQCKDCPFKKQCTTSESRVVSFNKNQDALDWAEGLRNSYAYKKSQYMRKQIERLFGEAKEQMGLRRARMRGKEKLTEQCLLTAMAQNIKRMVKASSNPWNPTKEGLGLLVKGLDLFKIRFLSQLNVILFQLNKFYSKTYFYLIGHDCFENA